MLEEENAFLRAKVEELEKCLLAYENAHTPSSQSKKKPPKKPSSGKVGAKEGHPKWERDDPEPTGSVEYVEEACPHCMSKLGSPVRTERVLEEEIPEPQPVEVIEHLVNHYDCGNCGKHVVAENNAPVGRFGRNLQTHVALMKFDDRLPLRKVTASLERHYGIRISDVGVFKITGRVAKKLEHPYKQIIRRVRKAEVIYVDETKIKIDGATYYIWTFVTENDVLFVIRKSRAKKVIQEILGQKYEGTICCDGWTAYSQYTNNLQRCWAHLLREAKNLAKKYTEFDGFYTVFKKMFKQINKMRSKPPRLRKREEIRDNLKKKMEQLIEQMSSYQEFKKFAKKVKNGLDYWFTCIVNLLVKPTNNTAERALRELVVQRKIIGGLRREKGARIMEVITSIVATCKLQEKPIFQTIKSHL